jgi:hypothetical protein
MRLNLTRAKVQQLRSIGIRSHDKIIHDQGRAWLQENFAKGATKFPVNVSALVRNILWQTYERIKVGERQPFTELIRTFWYTHVKPTLTRADALSDEADQANEVSEELVHLVVEEKLFNYADIGFRDVNEANRTVRSNPNVILFAEKIGHAAFLEEMGEKFQISTIAFGGQPGALTTEYFVTDIKESGFDLRRSFFLFSIVDYDPSGWIIRDAFVDNLNKFGINNVQVIDLINPDILTPEETSFSKFRVPAGRVNQKKNTAWLRNIRKRNFDNQEFLENEIGGDRRRVLFGLEGEAVSTERMEAKLNEDVPPLLGTSERILKINALESLSQSLNDLLIQKATG